MKSLLRFIGFCWLLFCVNLGICGWWIVASELWTMFTTKMPTQTLVGSMFQWSVFALMQALLIFVIAAWVYGLGYHMWAHEARTPGHPTT